MKRPVDNVNDFRRVVNDFLSASVPPRVDFAFEWGAGDDRVAWGPTAPARDDEPAAAAAVAKAWQKKRADAGLGWITGPVELGGAGLSPEFELAWQSEARKYLIPDEALVRTGTKILGPVLLRNGTSELKERYLPGIHSGEFLVCQLFSEPDAGSDLANVRLRGVAIDGGWLVTGQKTWSSGAQFADIGVAICRTEPGSVGHSGLSMLVIDMKAPGVVIAPIRQMSGSSEFCDVFFEEVFVPQQNLLAAVGDGWALTIESLMNERLAVGDEVAPPPVILDKLIGLARHTQSIQRPNVQRLLAEACAGLATTRLLTAMLLDETEGAVGPEFALSKLSITNVTTSILEAAAVAAGPQLIADSGEWGTYSWSDVLLSAPGVRIGGGTDQILKNGIAERVLGLPRASRPQGVS